MLLTVDVGNTNITLGLFEGKDIHSTFRITTQAVRTSDEFGSLIAEMIVRKGINIKSIKDVIISSVVPKVMYSLNSGIIKYFGIEPIIVGIGTKTGIKINRTDPREVGSDRIVDAVAAYELYGGRFDVRHGAGSAGGDLLRRDLQKKDGPKERISGPSFWLPAVRRHFFMSPAPSCQALPTCSPET